MAVVGVASPTVAIGSAVSFRGSAWLAMVQAKQHPFDRAWWLGILLWPWFWPAAMLEVGGRDRRIHRDGPASIVSHWPKTWPGEVSRIGSHGSVGSMTAVCPPSILAQGEATNRGALPVGWTMLGVQLVPVVLWFADLMRWVSVPGALWAALLLAGPLFLWLLPVLLLTRVWRWSARRYLRRRPAEDGSGRRAGRNRFLRADAPKTEKRRQQLEAAGQRVIMGTGLTRRRSVLRKRDKRWKKSGRALVERMRPWWEAERVIVLIEPTNWKLAERYIEWGAQEYDGSRRLLVFDYRSPEARAAGTFTAT